MPIVDVIVPVYRGAEATRRCLETLLAAPNRTAMEVVVVNDASPDPEIARHVRDLAQRRRVTLIEQPTQQGFAAAINRAVTLHRERDVVVLHSDAEVANDWLDRLSAHALERDVGMIVTMTSSAGTGTYPLPQADNALPPGHTVATLDAAFASANGGKSVSECGGGGVAE